MKNKNGWVPDQHGAWVMVLVPFLVGVVFAPALIHIPLFIAWMTGYFAFFALSLWLKVRSPRRSRYIPALVSYGGAAVVFGIVCVMMRPQLLWFSLVFAPLVAIAVWEAYRRRPRSLVSGIATVLASCAMFPATIFAATGVLTGVWVPTAVMAMYFCGTIPYVKTLIRNRGDGHWLFGSVAYHMVCTIAMAVLSWLMLVPWWAVVIFALYTFRAWWLPHTAQQGKKWSPRDVGIGEVFSTCALLAVLLAVGLVR